MEESSDDSTEEKDVSGGATKGITSGCVHEEC